MFSLKQEAPINYYIYVVKHDNIPVYIGCTHQTLTKRFSQHKTSRNSVIYQKYSPNFNNLNISILNILNNNEGLYSVEVKNPNRAFTLEKFLTYIFGYKYNLLNINAGNELYIKNNDEIVFNSIQMLLIDILDMNIILPMKINFELMLIIADACNYPITKEELQKIISNIDDKKYIDFINKLLTLCTEKLCENNF